MQDTYKEKDNRLVISGSLKGTVWDTNPEETPSEPATLQYNLLLLNANRTYDLCLPKRIWCR